MPKVEYDSLPLYWGHIEEQKLRYAVPGTSLIFQLISIPSCCQCNLPCNNCSIAADCRVIHPLFTNLERNLSAGQQYSDKRQLQQDIVLLIAIKLLGYCHDYNHRPQEQYLLVATSQCTSTKHTHHNSIIEEEHLPLMKTNFLFAMGICHLVKTTIADKSPMGHYQRLQDTYSTSHYHIGSNGGAVMTLCHKILVMAWFQLKLHHSEWVIADQHMWSASSYHLWKGRVWAYCDSHIYGSNRTEPYRSPSESPSLFRDSKRGQLFIVLKIILRKA